MLLATRIKKQGFLIYEILISLVIISVVAATLLPYLSQSKRQIISKVQNRNCEDALSQFISVLQSEPLLKSSLGSPLPGSPTISTTISAGARPAAEIVQAPSANQSPLTTSISTYTGFFPTAVGTPTASSDLTSVADELASHSILNLTGLMPDLTKLYNSRRADVCVRPTGLTLTSANIDSQLFPASANTSSPTEVSAQIKRALLSAERGGSQFELRLRLIPYDLVTGASLNSCPANIIPRPMNRLDPPYDPADPSPEVALPELLGPEAKHYQFSSKMISRIPAAYQRNVGFRAQIVGVQTTPEGQVKTCARAADFRYPPDFRSVPSLAAHAPRVAVLDYLPRAGTGHYDALGGPPSQAYTTFGSSGRPQCSANGVRPAYPLQNLMVRLRVGYFGGAQNMTPPTVGGGVASIQPGVKPLEPGLRLLCRDSSLPIYNNWCASAPEASVGNIADQSSYRDRGWVPCDQVTVCGVQQSSPAIAYEGPQTLAYDLHFSTAENALSTLSGCEVRMDVASIDPVGNIVTNGNFKAVYTGTGLDPIPGYSQQLVNNNGTRITFRPPDCFQCRRIKRRFGLGAILAVGLAFVAPVSIFFSSFAIGGTGLIAGGLCASGTFGTCRGSQSGGEPNCENKSGQGCGRRCRWQCSPTPYRAPIHWGQTAFSTKKCAGHVQNIADPQGLGRTIAANFNGDVLAGSAPIGIYYTASSISVNGSNMATSAGAADTFHSPNEALSCTATMACVDPDPNDPNVDPQWQVIPNNPDDLAMVRCENLLTRTRAAMGSVGPSAPIRSVDVTESTTNSCYVVAEQDQQTNLINFNLAYYHDFTNVGLAAGQAGSPPDCLTGTRVLCRLDTPPDPMNGVDATYAYPIDILGTIANAEANELNPGLNAPVPVVITDPNKYYIFKYNRPAPVSECVDQPNPSFNP